MDSIIKASIDTLAKGLESLKNIKKDKREYKAFEARIQRLPEDYKYVYKKMTDYMWAYSGGGNGYDMIALHKGLLELFEDGVAQGRSVLEVTGADVAAFCDELLRSAITYTEKRREQLNREVQKKVNGK